jgi:RNA polymerase sigma-70 factor (ECF subfamily)
LIDRCVGPLTLYARQWCAAAAEDVVQESFVRLAGLRAWPANPVAWLYRAVRHAAINAGRGERRRRTHEASAAASFSTWFQPGEHEALDAEAVTAVLAGLPDDERETLVARLWGGLSFEEIGAIQGTSAATAHRRYAAGLDRLRERLHVSCPTKPTTQD